MMMVVATASVLVGVAREQFALEPRIVAQIAQELAVLDQQCDLLVLRTRVSGCGGGGGGPEVELWIFKILMAYDPVERERKRQRVREREGEPWPKDSKAH